MSASASISRQRPKSSALDFATLRREAIAYLREVVGELWSDHNIHDPGITLLELLCYGITDVTYRTTFPNEVLFAPPVKDPDAESEDDSGEEAVDETTLPPFVSARHALTHAPLTANDYRKLFLDHFGELRNIWFDEVSETLYIDPEFGDYGLEPRESDWLSFEVKGLYRIRLLPEKNVPKARRKELPEEVRQFYYKHRNLCEDLSSVAITPEQDIVVCADIRLTAQAAVEATHAAVLHAVQSFLNPRVKRYTLAELAARGTPPDEIFRGPRLEGGFILDADLKAARSDGFVRTSDLIRVIMSVPGVESITKIQLNFPPRGGTTLPPEDWELALDEGHEPRLSFENAKFSFYKQKLPFASDEETVQKLVAALDKAEDEALTEVGGPFDRPIPYGVPVELSSFTSLQEALPLTYQVGSRGFDARADPPRLAQSKQLQAFLLIFDQLLANYLGQLVHLRDLFSTEPGLERSYFAQAVDGVPGLSHLISSVLAEGDLPADQVVPKYKEVLAAKVADHDPADERRSAILDHLLARFGEVFADHVLAHQSLHADDPLGALVESKRLFLRDVAGLSYRRAQGHDLLDPDRVWDTDNISGLQDRLGRLLGFRSTDRRDLSAEADSDDRAGEGMFVIENLLFRPSRLTTGGNGNAGGSASETGGDWPFLPAPCDASPSRSQSWDAYSFRVHLIFPGYGERFEEPMFRRLVRELVARELPAHLDARICFVGREHLGEFEKRYRAWLTALSRGKVTTEILSAFRDILEEVHTIYPPGTLHDCKDDGDEESAIVLDDTHLGSLPPDEEEGPEGEFLRLGDFDSERPPSPPPPFRGPHRDGPEPEPEDPEPEREDPEPEREDPEPERDERRPATKNATKQPTKTATTKTTTTKRPTKTATTKRPTKTTTTKRPTKTATTKRPTKTATTKRPTKTTTTKRPTKTTTTKRPTKTTTTKRPTKTATTKRPTKTTTTKRPTKTTTTKRPTKTTTTKRPTKTTTTKRPTKTATTKRPTKMATTKRPAKITTKKTATKSPAKSTSTKRPAKKASAKKTTKKTTKKTARGSTGPGRTLKTAQPRPTLKTVRIRRSPNPNPRNRPN